MVKAVDTTVTGGSVIAVVVVVEGVGRERQEQAVESAPEAQLCSSAGIVPDVARDLELDTFELVDEVVCFVVNVELDTVELVDGVICFMVDVELDTVELVDGVICFMGDVELDTVELVDGVICFMGDVELDTVELVDEIVHMHSV